MSDDTAPTFEPEDLQWAALSVADAWIDHDRLALAGLTPDQRRAQRDARQVVFEFVDQYRDLAKERHGQDVYHAPEWQVVAGMKDLLSHMLVAAEEACSHDEQDD